MNIKFFLILLACSSFLACKTDRRIPFKVVGKVNNLNGTEVSLTQFNIVYDVATVQNNAFSLSGNLTSMEMCEVKFSGDGYRSPSGKVGRWRREIDLFVEDEAFYQFNANSAEDIFSGTYELKSNSPHQNVWNAYRTRELEERSVIKAKLKDLENKLDRVLRLPSDSLYGVYLDSIRTYETKLMESRNTVQRKLINANPNTYAALYIASTAYNIPYDIPFYEGMYSRLSPEFRNHDMGKTLKMKIDDAKKKKK